MFNFDTSLFLVQILPSADPVMSQALAHFSFLAVWICIVRYHQLRDWDVKTWQNQLILWSGILCALGTSIVGNFQVRYARVHRWKLDYISLCFPRLLVALSVYSARKAFWDL